MSTTTTARFTTVDTGEQITAPALPAVSWAGDGYDWIDALTGTGWTMLPSWGLEGWDAGAWPLIILAVSRTNDEHGNLFGLGVYIEGDTVTRYFRAQGRHWAAITEEVFFHWKNGQSDGPAELPDTLTALPKKYRRPYTGKEN